MGQQVAFNTGRAYTKNGQRIAARVLDDGRVLFVDVDRNISGVTYHHHLFDADFYGSLRKFVETEYDLCYYNCPEFGLDVAVEALKVVARALPAA